MYQNHTAVRPNMKSKNVNLSLVHGLKKTN